MLATILWALVLRRRRARDLERIAPSLGLSFQKRDHRIADALQGLPLMQRFSHQVSNVLRGEVGGAELVLFDYSWKPFWDKQRADQTVAAYCLPSRALPELRLKPEGATDRLVAKLGLQDVDFETHPVFSASYRLKTDDETAIRAIFCPELLDHLELEAGWSLEGKGTWLVAYRAESLVAPSELHAFVEQTGRIAERLRGCTAPTAPEPRARPAASARASADLGSTTRL
jgi:hypothetical protein